MNRITKIAAATLLVACASFAQEGPKFGAYIGAGLSGFNGEDADEIDAALGWAAGGAMVMPLAPNIDLAANLLLSGRNTTWNYGGSSYTAADLLDEMGMTAEQAEAAGIDVNALLAQANASAGSASADMSEMGIDVPVMARYNMGPMFVQAGPQIGFNISSKTEDEDNDERAALEYGLTGGAGYKVSEQISVDARYYYGLSTIDDEGDFKFNPYYVLVGGTYMF